MSSVKLEAIQPRDRTLTSRIQLSKIKGAAVKIVSTSLEARTQAFRSGFCLSFFQSWRKDFSTKLREKVWNRKRGFEANSTHSACASFPGSGPATLLTALQEAVARADIHISNLLNSVTMYICVHEVVPRPFNHITALLPHLNSSDYLLRKSKPSSMPTQA